MKPRVFLTRALPEAGLAELRAACDLVVWPNELPPAPAELLAGVRGAAGILSLLTDTIDAGVMDAAGPALRVISNYAVGFDNIDVAAATARSIAVGNTPDVLTDTTADLAFALLMAAARHILEGDRYVRAGRWRTWEPQLLLGPDIAGATLGIIGFGRIGHAMAKRAHGFDMRVLYHNPYCRDDAFAAEIGAECLELEALLAGSDFVSLHTPLTAETRHLIDAAALAQMKPTAYLINTARGKICDRDAVVEALESGQLAGYAGDVWYPQPAPSAHPWRTMPHHGMTPHVSGSSLPAQARYAAGTREILESFFAGTAIREEYLIVEGCRLAGAGAHSYTAGASKRDLEEAA